MKRRPIAGLSVLALGLATIGGWQAGNSIAVHAVEGSSSTTSHEQTASPDPRAGTWEYKMLIGDPTLLGRTTAPARGAATQINLEEEINRFAVQGYVVESFQAFSSVFSTTDSNYPYNVLRSTGTVVVLLKRIRK